MEKLSSPPKPCRPLLNRQGRRSASLAEAVHVHTENGEVQEQLDMRPLDRHGPGDLGEPLHHSAVVIA